MTIQQQAAAIPEHAVVTVTRMSALRTLAEPLIGHAAEGESLARMIERVTRKEVVLPDLQAELDRLYVDKS